MNVEYYMPNRKGWPDLFGLVQAMHAPFIPGYNEHYYCVGNKDTIYSTVNRNEAADALCIALGNSFRTYNQAKANAGVIIKRIERATELLKKLQDEGEE